MTYQAHLRYNFHTLYWINTNFFEEKSLTRLTELLLMKPNAWAQAC